MSKESLRSKALDLYEAALNVPPHRDLGRRGGARGQLKRLAKSVVLGERSGGSPSSAQAKSVAVGTRTGSPSAQAKEVEAPADDYYEIRGGGCELRLFHDGDTKSLVKHGNDEDVSRFMRHAFPYPYTTEDARHWIDLRVADSPPYTKLAIVVNGECCGGIGIELSPAGEIDSHNAEIGYWLGSRVAGRGIMTEALHLFIDYVFETWTPTQVLNLTAHIFADNGASRRVLEKNGFTLCGVITSYYYKNGKHHDAMLLVKSR